MNELVVDVFYIEFLAGCTDVGILKEIPFEVAVDACHESVATEVELPPMY